MTNFNYTDLDSYNELINQLQDLTDDLKQAMVGAFPDNDREADLSAAKRYAERIAIKASDLSEEVKKLYIRDADSRSAEATCNCSNPYCQV